MEQFQKGVSAMSRSTRQSKILDIITNKDIETQEELVAELSACGIAVTQATISRDIKELGLVKTLSANSTYKYTSVKSKDIKISEKLLNVFREAVITIVSANNLVIVKTLSGSANAVAMVIDQMHFPEMFGSVAGDDTLLIIAKSNEDAYILNQKLLGISE